MLASSNVTSCRPEHSSAAFTRARQLTASRAPFCAVRMIEPARIIGFKTARPGRSLAEQDTKKGRGTIGKLRDRYVAQVNQASPCTSARTRRLHTTGSCIVKLLVLRTHRHAGVTSRDAACGKHGRECHDTVRCLPVLQWPFYAVRSRFPVAEFRSFQTEDTFNLARLRENKSNSIRGSRVHPFSCEHVIVSANSRVGDARNLRVNAIIEPPLR